MAILIGAWAGSSLSLRRVHRRSALGIALSGLLLFLYGFFSEADLSGSPRLEVALTQHNADSWQGGYNAYRG